MKKWELLGREEKLECGIFVIEEKTYRSPRTGVERGFVSAKGTDWVNVIALTPDDEVVFVRQFRHGRENITLEVPGGLVDPGEDTRDAGLRELAEETGYQGDDVVNLGAVEPNPAILDLLCHTYLVTNARPTCALRLDDTEDIEVLTIPLIEVPKLMADGTIRHALVIAAFSLLELHRKGFATLKAPKE